jgi:methyltransferase (TIGR00027 family)
MSVGASWDVVSGPGLTALGLASARAVESGMPDRLIDDPYAPGFVEAVRAPIPLPLPLAWPAADAPVSDQLALLLHGFRYIGLRSRCYDDYLQDAAAAGARQAVLLAAGLDTRAFRLSWPAGFRVFELGAWRPHYAGTKVIVWMPRCRNH